MSTDFLVNTKPDTSEVVLTLREVTPTSVAAITSLLSVEEATALGRDLLMAVNEHRSAEEESDNERARVTAPLGKEE